MAGVSQNNRGILLDRMSGQDKRMNEILHEKWGERQVIFVQTAPFLSVQRSVLHRKGIQANKNHLFFSPLFVQYFIHAFVLDERKIIRGC